MPNFNDLSPFELTCYLTGSILYAEKLFVMCGGQQGDLCELMLLVTGYGDEDALAGQNRT